MISLLDGVLGIVAALGGVLVGSWVWRRGRRTPAPPALMCSCGHGYGTHEAGARCHGEQERDRYNSEGDWTGLEYIQCPCRLYDGPEPLPRTWSPEEIAGGTP